MVIRICFYQWCCSLFTNMSWVWQVWPCSIPHIPRESSWFKYKFKTNLASSVSTDFRAKIFYFILKILHIFLLAYSFYLSYKVMTLMMMMISFFSIYDVPNTLCVLTNLIFPTLLWFPFEIWRNEAQGGWVFVWIPQLLGGLFRSIRWSKGKM